MWGLEGWGIEEDSESRGQEADPRLANSGQGSDLAGDLPQRLLLPLLRNIRSQDKTGQLDQISEQEI